MSHCHRGLSLLTDLLLSTHSWEFVTTLDYEWKVIQGRITYRWTIWVYSRTRVATLVDVILVIIRLDTTKLYHCQVRAMPYVYSLHQYLAIFQPKVAATIKFVSTYLSLLRNLKETLHVLFYLFSRYSAMWLLSLPHS
jgi:hypothetical protein